MVLSYTVYVHILHGIYIYSNVGQTVLLYNHGTCPKIKKQGTVLLHLKCTQKVPWYFHDNLDMHNCITTVFFEVPRRYHSTWISVLWHILKYCNIIIVIWNHHCAIVLACKVWKIYWELFTQGCKNTFVLPWYIKKMYCTMVHAQKYGNTIAFHLKSIIMP